MLNNTVSITIPSTQGVRGKINKIEHKARTQELLAIFGRMFGGATATDGIGSYIANDGTLVLEAVVIVRSYTDRATLEAQLPKVEAAASWYASEWAQESIAYEANGALSFATAL